jgi:hypothetical protein
LAEDKQVVPPRAAGPVLTAGCARYVPHLAMDRAAALVDRMVQGALPP